MFLVSKMDFTHLCFKSNILNKSINEVTKCKLVKEPSKLSNTKNLKKKRKHKRKRFKNIMRDAMKQTKTDEEIRQIHKQKIMESLGGGNFEKIDKI